MFRQIAGFEFRYQARSPLLLVAAALFFAAAFGDMAGAKLVSAGGGRVLFNSPHSVIVAHLLVSLVFVFVGAAVVSNVILRDDQTGFAPLIRSTRVTKFDYLFGRFLGAFAAGALVMAAATLGAWAATLMPFANQAMLGPNRVSAFAYGYGLFALPNALIISAVLFALATATRSTAGTFLGVVGLLILYLIGQRLMEGQAQLGDLRALADPFGMAAYMASARYFTAAELNAGAVPVTGMIVQSRLLWMAVAVALLALTYRLFDFSDRGGSRRRQHKVEVQAAAPTFLAPLATPRFGAGTAWRQFTARAATDARFILKSPLFLILLLIAFAFTLPSLMTASGFLDGALHPITSVFVPIIEASFSTLLLVIATYYGGELVWRERERRVHEIIDATPLPAWAFMLPKMLALAGVLFATLIVGMGVGILLQLIDGSVAVAPREWLFWFLLPGGIDAVLIAALAIFVQALSPGKYAGWGIMVLYILLLFFGPAIGIQYPLFLYGKAPGVLPSDMAGLGNTAAAAWWFRLFWAVTAALLLLAVHLLWPRGTEQRLRPRLRRLAPQMRGRTGLLAAALLAVWVPSGAWILYNTLILNDFRSVADGQRYLAEYEKRFFRYARLPQPVVRHVALDVALYPEQVLAEVRGRYRLVNETHTPISRVHLRLMNRDLALVSLEFPGAVLEREDAGFGYRIYRLTVPMRPGEARVLGFHTRRQQRGFRAAGTETGIMPNGTDLNTLELTPRIGMSDVGLIEQPSVRRKYGLPERPPLPRLDDLAATRITPSGDSDWTTADITVSTTADQVPVAPGRLVAERVAQGRRTVRFVSDTPVKNLFSIQSARYAVSRRMQGGVEHAVYFHPAHRWNVARMLSAMTASIDYYSRAFGSYPFRQIRVVERPDAGGGQAFPNTIAVGEGIFPLDMRNPDAFDAVTMLTAHELAHQWWGQQVVGARMQGASLVYETLAQYSALMVTRRLRGELGLRPFIRFQLDRYLSGRRTETADEQPLVRVAISQQHIAYGKGALALYLLQQRIGEAAVNRALRRFADRYRFTDAPYPRSVDLVAMLRAEAGPQDQALITDLFERITLYDLRVGAPTAVKRADGAWDVSVPVTARKFYANGRGEEQEAPLDDRIDIGLFAAADPADPALGTGDVIRMQRRHVRSGSQVFRFVTGRRPSHAGIDPFGLYIDRDVANHVAQVAD